MVGLLRPVNSYDAVDLTASDGTLTFWLVSGLDDGLDIRGEDTVIPGTAGRTARNRVADRRVIEIMGFVKGIGADDAARADSFRDAMESLRTLFLPTRTAAVLIIGLEDATRTATITARPLPDPMIDYKPVPAAIISVELEAVSPTWVIA